MTKRKTSPDRVCVLLVGVPLAVFATVSTTNEALAAEPRPKDAVSAEGSANGGPQNATASKADQAKEPSDGRRALSAGAALVPGVVAHGTGHFALGEPATARTLLFAELTGVGLILVGGIPIALSGASRYLVGPSAGLVVIGVGLFGTSFAADMYGTLSVDGGVASTRVRPPPWIETELGYRHVDDPVFDYGHFIYERISMMSGPLRVTPSAWFSTGGDNARYRVEGAYRLVGAIPSSTDAVVWNDRFDVVVGVVHHRYAPQQFSRSSVELAIDTRYDLAHVGPTLRGAFVEAALGYSIGRISYDVTGIDVPADTDSLLLGRLAFGAVLRGKSKPGSEVAVYYDHRHDDFAAGFVMPGLVSGVLGSVGVEGRWFFTGDVGASMMAEYGSALVAGLSVVFRQPGVGSSEGKRGSP